MQEQGTYRKLVPQYRGIFTGLVEVWKDIEGYEGAYQISSFGKVKSLARTRLSKGGSIARVPERIMSLKTNNEGYSCICLHLGSRKFFSVHRLVATAFIPNPELKLTVNHKNANKKDNNIINLEWATSSEQMQHAVINNLLERRGPPKFSKSQKRDVLQYIEKHNNLSASELSVIFSMSKRTIGRILNEGVTPRVVTCSTNDGVIMKTVTSKSDVEEIQRMRNNGAVLREIAERFNLGTSQVWRICKNLSRNNNFED